MKIKPEIIFDDKDSTGSSALLINDSSTICGLSYNVDGSSALYVSNGFNHTIIETGNHKVIPEFINNSTVICGQVIKEARFRMNRVSYFTYINGIFTLNEFDENVNKIINGLNCHNEVIYSSSIISNVTKSYIYDSRLVALSSIRDHTKREAEFNGSIIRCVNDDGVFLDRRDLEVGVIFVMSRGNCVKELTGIDFFDVICCSPTRFFVIRHFENYNNEIFSYIDLSGMEVKSFPIDFKPLAVNDKGVFCGYIEKFLNNILKRSACLFYKGELFHLNEYSEFDGIHLSEIKSINDINISVGYGNIKGRKVSILTSIHI